MRATQRNLMSISTSKGNRTCSMISPSYRKQMHCDQPKIIGNFPQAYRIGHYHTSFWSACQAVIPEELHSADGKNTGETAHVDHWNNTLRRCLGRFVRKTLSFSESLFMHDARLDPYDWILKMKIRVRYFASFREITGQSEEIVIVHGEASVLHVRDLLLARYPGLKAVMDHSISAVNCRYVTVETNLFEGDELAFIPPVGGGQ